MTSERDDLQRRALRLSWFTVGYNLFEGVVSIAAGLLAGSPSLMGFGTDSFVESLSGGVMIWRFGGDDATSEAREESAHRWVGYTFLVLATYVLYEAVSKLARGSRPEASAMGMGITALSLVVMPLLFWAKWRTAERLGSESLRSDAKQTLACVYLSGGVLAGLLLNRTFGWWQADPVIAIAIVVVLVREGWEAIRGEE